MNVIQVVSPLFLYVFENVCLSVSEVVELLLKNEAVTNVADSKGCYPLHLAAWKGDQRIVRLLIHKGTTYPKLNEQVCFYTTCLSVCLSRVRTNNSRGFNFPSLSLGQSFFVSFCLSLKLSKLAVFQTLVTCLSFFLSVSLSSQVCL